MRVQFTPRRPRRADADQDACSTRTGCSTRQGLSARRVADIEPSARHVGASAAVMHASDRDGALCSAPQPHDWELQCDHRRAAPSARDCRSRSSARGAKRGVGRPVARHGAHRRPPRMRGITLYEPTELVMSARAGTPLAADRGRARRARADAAFEPIDLGPAARRRRRARRPSAPCSPPICRARGASQSARRATICSASAASTAAAELFKAGGRVMKNVTGYDVCARPCRKLGHAGGADGGDLQGHAAARDDGDAGLSRAARRSRRRAAVRGDGHAVRGLGRRASAGAASAARLSIRPRGRRTSR